MMESIYSEEHQIFRETFRKFVAREITPNVSKWEAERAVPRKLWIKMGEQGYLCPWLPEEYGGLELDKATSMLVAEKIGPSASFSVAFAAHTGIEAVVPNPPRTLPGTVTSLHVLADNRIYIGGGFSRLFCFSATVLSRNLPGICVTLTQCKQL